MRQNYESVRGLVAVGAAVLLAGGSLVLSVDSARAEPGQAITDAMYWLQPAIGEAIIEQAKLERGMTAAMSGAVGEFNRALARQDDMRRHPLAWLTAVRKWDATVEANHAGRVQYVMGRSIVNSTQRGIRAGFMPLADHAVAYTRRIVGQANSWGSILDDEYLEVRQANLGAAIVEAGRDWAVAAGHTQERLGRAIGKIAAIQSEYHQALARNQEQMTALLAAVERTEARAEVFARLMSLDPAPAPALRAPTESTTSPSRPTTALLPFVFGLMAFVAFFRLFLSVGRMGRQVA